MSEPIWLRGAAVAAALAGVAPEHAGTGFGDGDAKRVADVMRRLRASGDRSAAAHAIARERMELVHNTAREQVGQGDLADAGAVVVASVLRSLTAGDRTKVVRTFDAALLRMAAGRAREAVDCNASAVLLVIARAVTLLARPVVAHEVGALAAVATGVGDVSASLRIHAALRWARVSGMDTAELFAPFAFALSRCERDGGA